VTRDAAFTNFSLSAPSAVIRPSDHRCVSRFAIIAIAALTPLAPACGASPGGGVAQLGSTTTTTQNVALGFSRCMRAHGVPNFPDPDSQGNVPPFQVSVSKQTFAAADGACKHLLASGGGGAGTLGDRQKIGFALKVASCMRSHGFPTYPDPTRSSTAGQGSGTRFAGTGIDTKSPQFQTAEPNCEQQARKALGLP
jgi:hypothetical protein